MIESPKTYGLPYKGSKRKLASRIMELMPPAEHFIDMFCGGCSMAHYALDHGKYRHVHINDIDARSVTMFVEAVNGHYKKAYNWVSAQDFKMFLNDPFISVCWSYCNNMREYMYDPQNERLRAISHRMLFSESVNDRYKAFLEYHQALRELVEDIRQEDSQKAEWGAFQRKLVSHTEYPEQLLEKNRKEWEKAMIRQQVMKPLVSYLWNALKRSKVTKSEIDKATGIQMAGHWFTNGSQWELPKEKHYRTLQKMLKHLNRPYSELRKQYESLKIKLDYLLTGTTDNERCWKNLQKLSHVGNINLVNTLAMNERQAARLTHSVGDYRSVEIPENSVIYCDPPYRGTDGYSTGFDYEAFYCWAESQSVPVFISEYDMPRDRFRCIAEFGHRSHLRQQGSNEVTERLFIPINQKWEDKEINLFSE